MSKKKAVFLDRDGTIVAYKPYLSSPEELELLPNAVEGIRLFKKNNYQIIIVTNQPGIAKGKFDEIQLTDIHKKLTSMLGNEGISIDDIYYCPHHIEGTIERYRIDCDCRKPKSGMILNAAQKHNIDLSQSIMIGDSDKDMEAGRNVGCKCILINHINKSSDSISNKSMDYVVTDLLEAARLFQIEFQ